MALNRTWLNSLVDDSGDNVSGSPWNKAAVTTFHDVIDAALATVVPGPHASTHMSGSTDPIRIDQLASPTDITTLNSNLAAHGLLPKLAGGVTLFLRADGTWAAPPGLGAHAATHKSGGSDLLRLDELGTPTDILTLNASLTAHGLLPKLPGGSTLFLRGDGTYAIPPGGGGGGGNVSGPGLSVVGRVATWADTAGTVIADGGLLLTSLVVTTDPRLSDARTPTTHATSHKSGGSDAIKLDELAATTDILTLNASLTAHGLLMKLGGGTANFLRADGTWAAPGGVGTVVAPTAWTPSDGSGAGLSWSPATGFYIRHGNLVLAFFDIQYPSTSNAAAARMNGLPVTAYGFVAAGGVLISLTNAAIAVTGYIGSSQSGIDFYTTAGVTVKNVDLSGKYMRGVAIYMVP